MLTVGIGETITIPARVITEDLLRAKLDWARTHNNPEAVNQNLRPGQVARILNAYPQGFRGGPELISVEFDAEQVNVTGLARGPAHVDIMDELSAPGAIHGMGGGVDVFVQDYIDRMGSEENAPVEEVVEAGRIES